MLEDTDTSIGLAAKPADEVTLPLSTSSSTLSSDHPDRVSESVRQRRSPARPRRSRVQSMPVGSKGSLDFFGTPEEACATPSSAENTCTYRKLQSDNGWRLPESHDELGCDEDVPEEVVVCDEKAPEKVVKEEKAIVDHKSPQQEQAKAQDPKHTKAQPIPGTMPDGKVDAGCQCIIL